MGFSRTLGVLGAAGVALGAIACEPPVASYGPPPACTANCGSLSGGAVFGGTGGSTTTTTTTTGGATGTIELTGSVIKIDPTDLELTTVPQYLGTANIIAPGPGGNVAAAYNGSGSPSTFDLVGVSPGNQWIKVQDTTDDGTILSTWSPVTLPDPTVEPQVQLSLPVIDQQMLNDIATQQLVASANHVETAMAQVVLLIEQGSFPLAGVSVTGNTGGATVAYDIGPGSFSDATEATSTAGTIILFNSGLDSTSTQVTLTLALSATNQTLPLPIQVTQGAATFMEVSVQ